MPLRQLIELVVNSSDNSVGDSQPASILRQLVVANIRVVSYFVIIFRFSSSQAAQGRAGPGPVTPPPAPLGRTKSPPRPGS